ncbi:MAG: hypothetical protein RI907_2082 [Pseudomonadota bacterium]|jgi:hydroxypyruvate reductase
MPDVPVSTTAQADRADLALLGRLYRTMLDAAAPSLVLPAHLPAPPTAPGARTVVVGVGKAAAAMAQAVRAHWPGPLQGVVVVPAGAALPLSDIDVLEASHPVPDERSVAAGQRLLQAVQGLGPQDLVIALVSGGGSALCAVPAPGVSLADKQAITRALLRSGATIHEINTVRKHLSAIKGGRLAQAAWPARVVSLVLSDVPGDDPALVASAPTLPDPSSCADALGVLTRHGVALPEAVREGWRSGALESPKPDQADMGARLSHRLVACAQDGLEAAARCAQAAGWSAHILSDAMQGEARDLALAHAAMALQVRRRAQPWAAPCVLLSGGEATVSVRGAGQGGRNTEFALALALALQGEPGICAWSAGSDGLDGTGDAAGAWVSPDTLVRAAALGLNARQALADNDSFSFFHALGDTVVTGPTHTNINDFRAVLIR